MSGSFRHKSSLQQETVKIGQCKSIVKGSSQRGESVPSQTRRPGRRWRSSEQFGRIVSTITSTLLQIPATPFPHLLDSNDPPSESDVDVIRHVIQLARANIGRLRDKRSPTHLHALKAAQLETFVRQHQAILSPCRRLPLEIIQRILLWVVSSTRQGFHYFGTFAFIWVPGISATPWYLGHISQRWRWAALAYPELWSDVRFTLTHKINRTQIKAAKEVFQRARGFPLHIQLKAPHVDFTTANHPLLALLLQHASTWQYFYFTGPTSMLASFNSGREEFKLLRLVVLTPFPRELTITDSGQVIDLFSTAPMLKEFALESRSGLKFVLPWDQLDHIHFRRSRSTETFQHILSQSLPNLTRLTITESWDARHAPPQGAQLPRLAQLIVRVIHPAMAAEILSVIRAPRLKGLQVLITATSYDRDRGGLTQLLNAIQVVTAPGQSLPGDCHESTSPGLESFSLRFILAGPVSLPPLRFLSSMPFLSHLEVDQMSPEDITKLGLPQDSGFLPVLRHVKIGVSTEWKSQDGLAAAIREVFKARGLQRGDPDSSRGGLESVVVQYPYQIRPHRLLRWVEDIDEDDSFSAGVAGFMALAKRFQDDFPLCLEYRGRCEQSVIRRRKFRLPKPLAARPPQDATWLSRVATLLDDVETLVNTALDPGSGDQFTAVDIKMSGICWPLYHLSSHYCTKWGCQCDETRESLQQRMRCIIQTLKTICRRSQRDDWAFGPDTNAVHIGRPYNYVDGEEVKANIWWQ